MNTDIFLYEVSKQCYSAIFTSHIVYFCYVLSDKCCKASRIIQIYSVLNKYF